MRFTFALLLTLSSCTLLAAAPPPLDKANYKEHWRNSDNSNRYTLELGGGASLPAGSTKTYQSTGFNVRVGGGYQFNRRIALVADYDFNHFGVPTSTSDQIVFDPLANGFSYSGAELGASGAVHLWSVTLGPRVRYAHSDNFDGYIVASGGFYRKLVRFNIPGECDSRGYCRVGYPSPIPLSHSSNNAGGVSVGTGIEWRVSYLPHGRYFIEGRYVWVDNHSTDTVYAPTSYRTGYFPVTVGLRW